LTTAGLLGAPGRFPTERWGKLVNHGNGSAFHAQISFITLSVTVGGEEFVLDAAKLSEFPYTVDANTIPASPSNISPGAEATFARIPTPILVGPSQARSTIVGIVVVSYDDLFDAPHRAYQHFRSNVNDSEELTITFGKEYTPVQALSALEPVIDAVPPELRPPDTFQNVAVRQALRILADSLASAIGIRI